MELADYRKFTDKVLAEFDHARRRYWEESKALEEAESKVGAVEEAQVITQQVAKEIQEQIHQQIAEVVSGSLEAVFDEPYKFLIHFERKRGRTEARLVFEREGLEVDPMSASGGGVIDVAAFALRLSCLMRARPPLRPLLILDEPFKFVSAEYRSQLRELLETLSREKKVQFLIVTHLEEFQVGKVISLG